MDEYPEINLDKKSPAQLYTDSLTWAVNNIPGGTVADRCDIAFRFYAENKGVTNWEIIYKKYIKPRVLEDIENGR